MDGWIVGSVASLQIFAKLFKMAVSDMETSLRGRRVFIDATEFVNARFDMRSPAFAELRKLCAEGRMILLTTDVTRREIEGNIQGLSKKVLEMLREVFEITTSVKDGDAAIVGGLRQRFESGALAETFSKSVSEFFQECRVVNLEIPGSAVRRVLDLYFGKDAPFGGGNKKEEFPDAFVLEAIRAALKPGESIYVVSGDKDLERACAATSNLVHAKSLAFVLNSYNADSAIRKIILRTVDAHMKEIMKILQTFVRSMGAETPGRAGSATMNSIRVDDILDVLVISWGEQRAAVEFVCSLDVDATLETVGPNGSVDSKRIDRTELVGITVIFRFDRNNRDVFEEEQLWAPSAIQLWL